jgi:hypothetical protein
MLSGCFRLRHYEDNHSSFKRGVFPEETISTILWMMEKLELE